jgi:TRAP-type C4-dicarboxylate transport system permease small subunit
MKKYLIFLLQLLSLFLFIVLIVGVFTIIKDVIGQSERGLAFNIGYSLAAIIVFGVLFWLNIKLFKFSNQKKAAK